MTRPAIVTIPLGSRMVLTVVVTGDLHEFASRPEIARVYREITRTPFTDAPEDRAEIVALIEKHCVEYMTPQREQLARQYLAEGEPLTSGDIRERARREHGIGFGHGNALLGFLKDRAVGDDAEKPLYKRRFTLAEADLLAAEWEGGPGRGE